MIKIQNLILKKKKNKIVRSNRKKKINLFYKIILKNLA